MYVTGLITWQDLCLPMLTIFWATLNPIRVPILAIVTGIVETILNTIVGFIQHLQKLTTRVYNIWVIKVSSSIVMCRKICYG